MSVARSLADLSVRPSPAALSTAAHSSFSHDVDRWRCLRLRLADTMDRCLRAGVRAEGLTVQALLAVEGGACVVPEDDADGLVDAERAAASAAGRLRAHVPLCTVPR